jgi:hypothetical protein
MDMFKKRMCVVSLLVRPGNSLSVIFLIEQKFTNTLLKGIPQLGKILVQGYTQRRFVGLFQISPDCAVVIVSWISHIASSYRVEGQIPEEIE